MWPGWSLLGDDCIWQSSRLQDLGNPGSLDWAVEPSVCQWCLEAFAKRSAVFPPHVPFRITQSHGLKRGSSPRCPLPAWWVNLLPLVWKRRSKWRNSGQPLADNAQQARTSLWQVFPLPFNNFRGHTASWLRLQAAQGKQCQRGRWGAWQCNHIRLTSPNHPLQPIHYPQWWQWCEHLKTLTLPITLTFQYLCHF